MKRVLFIGQAMPAVKRHPHHWPSLNVWLYSIGLTDDDIKNNFKYTAIVDYFPGYKNRSHRVPSKEEIMTDSNRLKETILEFKPDMIVPIGRLSIANCFKMKSVILNEYIGNDYITDAYGVLENMKVLPLPHPSGASTWRYQPGNLELLQKALHLLKKNLN